MQTLCPCSGVLSISYFTQLYCFVNLSLFAAVLSILYNLPIVPKNMNDENIYSLLPTADKM